MRWKLTRRSWQMHFALATAMAGAQALPAETESRPAATSSQPAKLAGFQISRHFGEQVKSYSFDPEVSIHINAPAPDRYDLRRPTRVMLYALPNGNSIAETIGRKPEQGLHWRYNIQHIGAQTRRLREVITGENVVIAYLEAQGKSWPAWKQRHGDYRKIIPRVIASIVGLCPGSPVMIELSGHSGGGSFIFGYLDSFEAIPQNVRRITFLDSNYGYSDENRHGDKLIAWLKVHKEHCLGVICYDDREVLLDGKHIVGPRGGTWRATERMIARLSKDIKLARVEAEGLHRYGALDGRIDIIMHPNPMRAILHTAVVGDMNGFIHACTFATSHESAAGRFNGGVAYSKWVQKGE